MPSVRLLADDLTGALDAAAEFVGLCGAFDVTWPTALPANRLPSLAIDTGTRELPKAESAQIVAGLAPLLGQGDIAYKKVDSLLRGAWATELAACLRSGHWETCIVAPAFAYQGRRTRGGQQYARTLNGEWTPVGANLLAQLAAEDVTVSRARFGSALADGVHVFDAESDEDLDRAVEMGRRAPGPVLWCGSGGLASALVRGSKAGAPRQLRKPVLGLFGSDQVVTAAQLAACGSAVLTLTEGDPANPVRVGGKLAADGVALVKFDLPAGLSRGEAAARIAAELGSLTSALDPPGTLVVAGGETLKAVCLALGAHALQVYGRIVPGLPRSLLQGGRWSGVDVISKSGAFGSKELWRDLLLDNQLTIERSEHDRSSSCDHHG
jgi:uncharacterized protein YgbK (DUF1537 family)